MSSIVSTTTCNVAMRMPIERLSVYAVGLYWVFYPTASQGNMCYRTSVDGVSWSSATIVRACDGGADFSVWLEGTDTIHYVFGYNNPTLWGFKYRKGTLNGDGTISWVTDEQTIDEYLDEFDPVICVDSDGYPWIGYTRCDVGSYRPYVVKSSTKDGTWTTADDFPHNLKAVDWYNVIVVPLTNGRVYVVYTPSYYATGIVSGKLWDGSSLGSEEDASSSNICIDAMGMFTAVAYGDDVHVVFRKYDTNELVYVKRTYGVGWSEETVIQDNLGTKTSPALTLDVSTGNLYCFWLQNNHVYYKKYTASTSTWDASPTDWLDESSETLTSNRIIGSFYQVLDNKIGVYYMTNTASPYNVKFAFLTLEEPPPTTAGILVQIM